MAVGAIEGRFYTELLKGLGLDPGALPHQNDMAKWPELKDRFARVFKTKTRDAWERIFTGKDACVAPILELNEVESHPHNRERDLLVHVDGFPQPAPLPGFPEHREARARPEGRGGHTHRKCWESSGFQRKRSRLLFAGRLWNRGTV